MGRMWPFTFALIVQEAEACRLLAPENAVEEEEKLRQQREQENIKALQACSRQNIEALSVTLSALPADTVARASTQPACLNFLLVACRQP